MEDTDGNKEIANILNLLQAGDKQITFCSSVSDVVLLIGNTGSGKSTLAQFLSSNENLVSIETSPNSGEFIIIDDNNKISTHSTIISQTVFPELIVSDETKSVFYDCPGFSDSRNAAHDIAATYFTKKVVDKAKKVKLLFVVNYPSVRKGVDRLDFMLLVKHALKFAKNIDKFKNSIGLLVTKVDNHYRRFNNSFQLVPEEVVISTIAEFLVEFKLSLKEMKHFKDDLTVGPEFYENASKFIDILLERDGSYYKRIRIFRRPDDAGPLMKINILKNEKIEIERLIQEILIFSDKFEDDFGYSISDDSKCHVYDLDMCLNMSITYEIQQIGEKIKTYFQNIEKNKCQDIHYLLSKFNSAVAVFAEFICNLSTNASYIRDFILNYDELSVDNFEIYLKNIENYVSHLQFLKLVSGHKTLKRSGWVNGFSHLIAFLEFSVKWYSFLVDLYSVLSDYLIQKDIHDYDVTELTKLCSSTEFNNMDLHALVNNVFFQELLTFINGRIRWRGLESMYFKSDNVFLNWEKLMSFKNVLNHTFNHKTSIERLSLNKLVIKGDYIQLSKLNIHLLEENIKYINIFAINKVFIDENIEKSGKRIHLCIMSPVWEVIGDRKIVLDGSVGSDQHDALMHLGMDGAPGKAGGPAGNFFGVAGNVIGGFLLVSANGGRGGCGQDGQRGADGTEGDDGLDPKNIQRESLKLDEWRTYNGFDYIIREAARFNLLVISGHIYEYEGPGKRSTDGSRGGNGGIGGKGGNAGKIRVEDLSKSGKIIFSTVNGDEGPFGKGGIGGRGVQNGRTVTAKAKLETVIFIPIDKIKWENTKKESYGTFSAQGCCGSDGSNIKGREEPEVGDDMIDCSAVINSYKIWTSKPLSTWIGDPSLPCFLQKIEEINCQSSEGLETIRSEFEECQSEQEERQSAFQEC